MKVKGNLIRLGWLLVGSSNFHTRCMVCCGRMGNWGSTYDMMNKWRMKSTGKWCIIGKGNWNWYESSVC